MKLPVWLLWITMLLTSCKSDSAEPQFTLTPATQTGANTLSFRIDGKMWQPYGTRCFGFAGGACITEPLDAYYNTKGNELILSAYLTTGNRSEDFFIVCDSLAQAGIVGILPPSTRSFNTRNGHISYVNRLPGNSRYSTFDASRTQIQITRFDTVAHIISGTFNGYLQNHINFNQAVTITDGRFDIKY